jgi:DNA-binding NarL/FixJ family response regulator
VQSGCIVVADPVPLFRAALRTLLERERVQVHEASDLPELLARVDGSNSIAIVCLDLPPLGGVAAIEALALAGGPPTVAWSLAPSGDDVVAAVEAGAAAVVRKDTPIADLLGVLRTVSAGATALDPVLGGVLIDAVRRRAARQRACDRASALTARERTVLELASGGLRNREIAETLGLSEFTVKRHMQKVLQKLALPTRHAAAALYRVATTGEARPAT